MPRYKFVKRIEREDKIPENSKAADKSKNEAVDPFANILNDTKIEKAIRNGNFLKIMCWIWIIYYILLQFNLTLRIYFLSAIIPKE